MTGIDDFQSLIRPILYKRRSLQVNRLKGFELVYAPAGSSLNGITQLLVSKLTKAILSFLYSPSFMGA